jgi:hypothetical protein
MRDFIRFWDPAAPGSNHSKEERIAVGFITLINLMKAISQ